MLYKNEILFWSVLYPRLLQDTKGALPPCACVTVLSPTWKRPFSEQTFERLHSKWAEYSEYKLRSETTDPQYGNVLLNVVKDFNSLHLR